MNRVPAPLRHLDAVAAATLSLSGELRDANAGFLRLLGQDQEQGTLPVASFFIRPSFTELLALASGPGGFSGVFQVAPPGATGWSLHGTILRVADELVVVGEHDVRNLEALTLELLNINEQLAELQRELQRANRGLRASEERFRELSHIDTLTNVANRRAFHERLAAELEKARRYAQRFALVATDIDLFKQVNDGYGHTAGDHVLRAFAAMLAAALRPGDFVARVGGEEFNLLLPGADAAAAQRCAQRLCASTARLTIPEYPGQISASFGVAEHAPGDSAETLVKRADAALYAAKAAGRNRVVSSPSR